MVIWISDYRGYRVQEFSIKCYRGLGIYVSMIVGFRNFASLGMGVLEVIGVIFYWVSKGL